VHLTGVEEMKEEALKLADELEALHQYVPSEAPVMIRRLVEELDEKNYRILELTKRYKALTWNDKQGEPVAWWNGKSKFCSPRDKSWDAKTGGILSFGCNIPLYTTPQTKPLTDDEILDMSDDYIANQFELAFEGDKLVEYVRAVIKKAGQR
jgi:hypothetical protein